MTAILSRPHCVNFDNCGIVVLCIWILPEFDLALQNSSGKILSSQHICHFTKKQYAYVF